MVQVNKLVHESNIATWNIGTLIRKLVELVNIVRRRDICLQETRSLVKNLRKLEDWLFNFGVQVKMTKMQGWK